MQITPLLTDVFPELPEGKSAKQPTQLAHTKSQSKIRSDVISPTPTPFTTSPPNSPSSPTWRNTLQSISFHPAKTLLLEYYPCVISACTSCFQSELNPLIDHSHFSACRRPASKRGTGLLGVEKLRSASANPSTSMPFSRSADQTTFGRKVDVGGIHCITNGSAPFPGREDPLIGCCAIILGSDHHREWLAFKHCTAAYG